MFSLKAGFKNAGTVLGPILQMRNDLERIKALSFFFGHAASFVYLSLKVIVKLSLIRRKVWK